MSNSSIPSRLSCHLWPALIVVAVSIGCRHKQEVNVTREVSKEVNKCE